MCDMTRSYVLWLIHIHRKSSLEKTPFICPALGQNAVQYKNIGPHCLLLITVRWQRSGAAEAFVAHSGHWIRCKLARRARTDDAVLCMCQATLCQPRAAADGAPQENPVSNRGPSIRHGKKNIVDERGLLKTAFPLNMYAVPHFYVKRDSFVCVAWLIHMSDVFHLYVWDLAHSNVWHDSFICVMWLIHMCDMTPLCVWHDSFICVTCLIYMCDMTQSYMWCDSSIWVARLIHTCDMIHSYVWHDSFICVTWPIHVCDMTHSYVWQDSFIYMSWLLCTDIQFAAALVRVMWLIYMYNMTLERLHMGDMTHSYVWHDSIVCLSWLLCTEMQFAAAVVCVTWLIRMCDMTHSYV